MLGHTSEAKRDPTPTGASRRGARGTARKGKGANKRPGDGLTLSEELVVLGGRVHAVQLARQHGGAAEEDADAEGEEDIDAEGEPDLEDDEIPVDEPRV